MIGFNNGKSSIFAAFLAILTSFHFLEVDPELFQIEESAVFNQNIKFVFDYLADSHHIPEVYETKLICSVFKLKSSHFIIFPFLFFTKNNHPFCQLPIVQN